MSDPKPAKTQDKLSEDFNEGYSDGYSEGYSNGVIDAEQRIATLEEALRLFAKYAPLSGDMAVMIRGMQGGGRKAADRADEMIEHFEHLNEAHAAARAALAATEGETR